MLRTQCEETAVLERCEGITRNIMFLLTGRSHRTQATIKSRLACQDVRQGDQVEGEREEPIRDCREVLLYVLASSRIHCFLRTLAIGFELPYFLESLSTLLYGSHIFDEIPCVNLWCVTKLHILTFLTSKIRLKTQLSTHEPWGIFHT